MENAPETVHRNASWGALISIFVILAMVVVGAFYAWGERVAQEHPSAPTATTSVSATSPVHKS